MLNQLASKIHENSKAKGFYDKELNVGEKLMLVVTEISEALEAYRSGKFADRPTFDSMIASGKIFREAFEMEIKDSFEDELADAVIRLLDLAKACNIDIDFHVNNKHKFNETRPYKHNKVL